MRTPTSLGCLLLVVAACSANSSSSEDVEQSGANVSAGQVFNFGAIAHPGSCMDAFAAGTADGTQIQEFGCNGTAAQSFELVNAGGGAFSIVNTHANKCVDVAARGTANGTKIQLFDCNGTSAQSYYVENAGGGFVSFVNTNSGKCLDVQGDNPADGTVVQLFDCNGTNAQRWNPTVIGGAASGGSSSGSTSSSGSGSTGTSSSGGSSSSGSSTPVSGLPNGERNVEFVNKCGFDVFIGALGDPVAPTVPCSAGCPSGSTCNTANQLCTFEAPGLNPQLSSGQSTSVTLPAAWGGRFWPRTECTTANGHTTCATGDCGGNLVCPVGVGGAPPATLAEFTMVPGGQGSDFYDVSNVDGSNIAVSILPTPGTFEATPPPGTNVPFYCASPGCTSNCGQLEACSWDVQQTCPAALVDKDSAGNYVGCRSANQVCALDPGNATLNCAENDDLYGCTGGGPHNVSGSCYSAGAPATCCGCPSWSPPGACQNSNPAWTSPSQPETFAAVFKNACPTAYSFPFDDPTSTFTCRGSSTVNPSYTITFCP